MQQIVLNKTNSAIDIIEVLAPILARVSGWHSPSSRGAAKNNQAGILLRFF